MLDVDWATAATGLVAGVTDEIAVVSIVCGEWAGAVAAWSHCLPLVVDSAVVSLFIA